MTMAYVKSLLLLALACAPAAFAAEAIEQVDTSWNTLRQRSDVEGLDRLMDERFVLVHSDGRVQYKADYVAELRTRTRVNGPILNEDVKIRSYGDTAIVNGVSVQSGVSNGQPWSGRFRFTRVWRQQDGNWKIVSSHSSRIADQAR
ncbi:MAG TPA: nuclear transport factor 2 family protein [Telluria sp.]|nr:nuclear transport factor 2 family protein [Telluria sp.]